jgi:hypothetical protein
LKPYAPARKRSATNLFVTDKGEQLVIEQREQDGPFELIFIHRDDEDDNLADWLETQGGVKQHMPEVLASRDSADDATRKLVRILDELSNAIRYAKGSIGVLLDSDLATYQEDAVGAIQDRLLTAHNLVEELGRRRDLVPSLAPKGLGTMHEQILAEVREENPGADDDELNLRAIIHEHIAVAMSPHEEDETYKRLSNVWQS